MRRVVLALSSSAVLAAVSAPAAVAHDHYVQTPNHLQYLANQNGSHAAPTDGFTTVCGGEPAWYGLEVAHHGADVEPGRSDGCYQTTADIRTPEADRNPAIN